uniref:TIL domain-containing protein n=1 Tax=Ciona savignyi TaxID=51511 RepID=H2ZPX3_CIOSA
MCTISLPNLTLGGIFLIYLSIVICLVKDTSAQSCPGNQVYSDCAGCDVICNDERRNVICTQECRQKCTCLFPASYLYGVQCVTDRECAKLLGDKTYWCGYTNTCSIDQECCGVGVNTFCCPVNNYCCRNGTQHYCSPAKCSATNIKISRFLPHIIGISVVYFTMWTSP